MIKTVASIQVRMGSTRLPGKVMKDLVGKPVLGRLVDRVNSAKLLDEIVVATSTNPLDDIIYDYCKKNSISVFRGSEDDVLKRIIGVMDYYNADQGVTLFGDCPCIDPEIIDEMVNTFLSHNGKYDFVGNDLATTYPPGLEVEVYKIEALKDAHKRSLDSKVKEHGTLYIRQHPEIYKLLNIRAPNNLFYPEMEIELDTAEDFLVIEAIYKHFINVGRLSFSSREIIDFLLKNKELQASNSHVERLWKEYREE